MKMKYTTRCKLNAIANLLILIGCICLEMLMIGHGAPIAVIVAIFCYCIMFFLSLIINVQESYRTDVKDLVY